jgi:putative phosphoesterase
MGIIEAGGGTEVRQLLIGVVSDTHIPRRAKAIPAAVLEGLKGAAMILHAGDILDRAVLDEFAAIAPVAAVAGNGDPPELVRELGRRKLIRVGGWRIGLVHGDGTGLNTRRRAALAFAAADCVVFGHSHIAYNQEEGGRLLFNPGSPTDRRRSPRPSFGRLYVEDERVRGEIVYF